ncbi:MAG: acetyl-CoA carboxylase biotin carboxylase subunit [Candidatus Marinimicrobia bacterium]|nr:acetyl-CoA carboxylase biotin carboxylase subunit [Candidatus Neomarinimicrobiota bacterium]|tara:strand:+ start:1379 stop:2737 length:1359 start_codon:yes stop_codon:yes gene_type:complete
MFDKILIANRGEIALRVIRACKELGIKTVAVYSEADELSLHTRFADEAICIGPAVPKKSYLNIGAIISAAELTNSDAIHPGYGFLSENPEFCRICEEHSIRFIGPKPDTIEFMGNKSMARKMTSSLNVPVIPGTENPIANVDEAINIADSIGYPIILKAVSGGGGKGMRVVEHQADLLKNFEIAKTEALNSFKDDRIYMEKFLNSPKHIEVQVLADKFGNICTLGTRDCSVQRNHQKIIEEAPSVSINPNLEVRLLEDSIKIAKKCSYLGVGTVEFLVSGNEYYFIEMNTRIQVEHTVTEMIYSYDLIKGQILIHSGEKISDDLISSKSKGHAIECRITAEDSDNNFMPSPGKIKSLHFPGGLGVRIDSHIYAGYVIPPNYDSMIAKIIVYARDRKEAILKMKSALSECVIEGIKTIIPYHLKILDNDQFKGGKISTKFLEHLKKEEDTYVT